MSISKSQISFPFGFLVLGFFGMKDCCGLISLAVVASLLGFVVGGGEQPLSKISIHRATLAIHDEAYVKVSPTILGLKVFFKDKFFCSMLCPFLCRS